MKSLNKLTINFIKNFTNIRKTITIKMCIIIALTSFIAAFNFLDSEAISESLVNDTLFRENNAYLFTSEERITKTIFFLSGIEGLYKALESAEFGINFLVDTQITIGKEITALADQTSQARNHAEYLLIAVSVLQLILAITHDSTTFILNILLIIFLSFFILSYWKKFFLFTFSKKLTYWLSILFINIHLIIPYSIHVAALFSHTITTTYTDKHLNNLDNLHKQITAITQNNFQEKTSEDSIDNKKSTTSLEEKHTNFREKQAKSLLKKFEIIHVNFDKYLRYFYSNWYKHLLYELLSVFVIPFTLIITIILYFRSIYSKLFLNEATNTLQHTTS